MRQTHHDVSTEHPGRDWPLAALALAGLGVSLYLTAMKLAGGSVLFCRAGSPCAVVQGSRYATFLGVPTAAWGAALYALVAVLALAGLTRPRWMTAFVLAVAAVSFSAYLTYLELFDIGAVCPYCVLAALIAAGVFAIVLWHVPRSRRGRPRVRPGRVIAIGAATAFFTIGGAVQVFVSASPEASAGYREGLARHLASSGAVMYGAYW